MNKTIWVGALVCAAAAFPSLAAEPKPKAGLWELTMTQAGKKSVDKECITDGDLKNWGLFIRPEKNCKEDCTIGKGKIDCATTCTYDGSKQTGTVKGTYNATSYQMEMKSSSVAGGKPQSNSASLSGRFLASHCPKESSSSK